ncbi:MAG TPA: sulfatase, partial [Verrucomicrobiota bacterium]|nr:sulfatase [Verrucomicrobiota bacterium]
MDEIKMNDLFRETDLMMTRRQLFGRTALGLGTAAMVGLMGRDSFGAPAEFKGGLHHIAKAKRVIYLFMS